MDSGDLKQIAVDHGDLIEDPLPDEIFFAGFGFRAEREFNNDSSPGPCPPQPYSEEANSTMYTLLGRPSEVIPLCGEAHVPRCGFGFGDMEDMTSQILDANPDAGR